jgi:hypothetical protein
MAHQLSQDETKRRINEYLNLEVDELLERIENYPRALLPGDIINQVIQEIMELFRKPIFVRDPDIFKGEIRWLLLQTQFLVCEKWRCSTTIDLEASDDESVAVNLFEYLMKWERTTESALLLTALIVQIGLHRFCEEIPQA